MISKTNTKGKLTQLIATASNLLIAEEYKKVVTLLQPYQENQNEEICRLLAVANMEIAKHKAFDFLMTGNYKAVIQLLQPYEKNQDIELLHKLAVAYMETSNPENGKELALPLWKTISSNALKESDYDNAVVALTSIVTCYQYRIEKYQHQEADVKARDSYIDMALKFINNPDKKFIIITKDGKKLVSEDLRKQRKYQLCLNAGIFNMYSGNGEKNRLQSAPYYQKALEFFDKALEAHPADLQCILYKARVLVIVQSPLACLRFLKQYESQFTENPSYHKCMSILYTFLKDEDHKKEYELKYKKSGSGEIKDNLSFIFSDILTLQADEISPDDQWKIATLKIYQGEEVEAKTIVDDLLEKDPNDLNALELSLFFEDKRGDHEEKAATLREQIFAIDKKSLMALKSKAYAILREANKLNGVNESIKYQKQAEAYMLLVQAYDANCRDFSLLEILTSPENNFAPVQAKIDYALEFVKLKGSIDTYFNLVMAYIRGDRYSEALGELKNIRSLDDTYKCDWVSLMMIICKMRSATTQQDYQKCVMKLKIYNENKKSDAYKETFDTLVQNLSFYTDVSELRRQEVTEKEEKLSPLVRENDQWSAPDADVIAKTKELMLRMNFASEEMPKKCKDTFDLLKMFGDGEEKRIYPINNGKNEYIFLDPKAKFNSDEEEADFKKVFESGVELPASSEGEPGIKRISNNFRVAKLAGSGSRMPTTSRLFVPATADTPEKILFRVKKVRSHDVAYKPRR